MATFILRSHRSADRYTPVSLIEEAVHLVRSDGGALAVYYLGALPFAFAAMRLVNDAVVLVRDPVQLGRAAVLLAALACWKNFCQALFSARMMAAACGTPPPRHSALALVRLFLAQNIIQLPGMFILPFTCLFMGFATVFMNAFPAVMALEPHGRWSAQARKTLKVTLHHPAGFHGGLLLLALFGILMFLNTITAVFVGVLLLKSFGGIETPLSKIGSGDLQWRMVMNTAVLGTAFFTACLVAGPFVKTFVVLHTFYADSVAKGLDLLAEVRRLAAQTVVRAAVVAMVLAGMAPAGGAAVSAQAVQAFELVAIEPEALSNAIARTLASREFLWTMPPAPEEAGQEPFSALFDQLGRNLGRFLDTFVEFVRDFSGWLRKLLLRDEHRMDDHRSSFSLPPMAWWMLAVVLFLVIAAVIVWYVFRHRRAAEQLTALRSKAEPNLDHDDVSADDADADDWLRRAAALAASGSLRLALRALFLATLNVLGSRNALSIARHKTNAEYYRELSRRYHDHPGSLAAFHETMSIFERVWYGEHEPTPAMLDACRRNYDMARN